MNNGTAAARFADSPHHQPYNLKYADVLLEVQQAICAGDDEKAGRLCDESRDLAESLSGAEARWMQGLSSDLESLCDQELLAENPYSTSEYRRRLTAAYEQRDAHALLALLRLKQSVLPKDAVAFQQSRAYAWLGFAQISLEFLRLAQRLAPENPEGIMAAADFSYSASPRLPIK